MTDIAPKPTLATKIKHTAALVVGVAIVVAGGFFPPAWPALKPVAVKLLGASLSIVLIHLSDAKVTLGQWLAKFTTPAALLLLTLGGLALAGSSCVTMAQVKQAAVDCAHGQLGKDVVSVIAVSEQAIDAGDKPGAAAATIGADVAGLGGDFVMCALDKLAADQVAEPTSKPATGDAPPAMQIATVRDAYLAAHPALTEKTYDVSHVVIRRSL